MSTNHQKIRALIGLFKQKYWPGLRKDPNLAGIGFGKKFTNGRYTDEYGLTIFVHRKLPKSILPASLLLPRFVEIGGDKLETDIVESGPIYPTAYDSYERPMKFGISGAHTNYWETDGGTLGCLVKDAIDDEFCILSCNHVIAQSNMGAMFDPVHQPAPADSGSALIGSLKRWVDIQFGMYGINHVDAAIASVEKLSDVVDEMKTAGIQIPSSNHLPVGLHFANSNPNNTDPSLPGELSFCNPMADVFSWLNITLTDGSVSVYLPFVDDVVEKVGRTTEYTTSKVKYVDVDINGVIYGMDTADFQNQIAIDNTGGAFTQKGDSGAVVCELSDGTPPWDAGASRRMLRTDLTLDEAIEKEFRQKYLSQTRAGRYLVNTYLQNERGIRARFEELKESREDADLAKRIYDKYVTDFRSMLLNPHNCGLPFTREMFDDLEQALGRAAAYLRDDEVSAARESLSILKTLEGKKMSDLLAFLDERRVLDQVARIIQSVASLKSLKED